MKRSEFPWAVQFLNQFGYSEDLNLIQFCERWGDTNIINYATYLAAAE